MSEGEKRAEGRRFDSAMALVSAISSDGKSVRPFDNFKNYYCNYANVLMNNGYKYIKVI